MNKEFPDLKSSNTGYFILISQGMSHTGRCGIEFMQTKDDIDGTIEEATMPKSMHSYFIVYEIKSDNVDETMKDLCRNAWYFIKISNLRKAPKKRWYMTNWNQMLDVCSQIAFHVEQGIYFNDSDEECTFEWSSSYFPKKQEREKRGD